MTELSVAGVVLSDKFGRYLLVQERKKDAYKLWNLPAGHVDEGEVLYKAAERETREETGFIVNIIDSEPLLVTYNKPTKTRLNSFRAEIIQGKLTVQKSELLDAKWFTFEEILELEKTNQLRTSWVKKSIDKARENENIGD